MGIASHKLMRAVIAAMPIDEPISVNDIIGKLGNVNARAVKDALFQLLEEGSAERVSQAVYRRVGALTRMCVIDECGEMTGSHWFCDKHWRVLPQTYKRRWWIETNYGRDRPSDDLIRAANKAYGGGS